MGTPLITFISNAIFYTANFFDLSKWVVQLGTYFVLDNFGTFSHVRLDRLFFFIIVEKIELKRHSKRFEKNQIKDSDRTVNWTSRFTQWLDYGIGMGKAILFRLIYGNLLFGNYLQPFLKISRFIKPEQGNLRFLKILFSRQLKKQRIPL